MTPRRHSAVLVLIVIVIGVIGDVKLNVISRVVMSALIERHLPARPRGVGRATASPRQRAGPSTSAGLIVSTESMTTLITTTTRTR